MFVLLLTTMSFHSIAFNRLVVYQKAIEMRNFYFRQIPLCVIRRMRKVILTSSNSKLKKETCWIFYTRWSRAFRIKIHPLCFLIYNIFNGYLRKLINEQIVNVSMVFHWTENIEAELIALTLRMTRNSKNRFWDPIKMNFLNSSLSPTVTSFRHNRL